VQCKVSTRSLHVLFTLLLQPQGKQPVIVSNEIQQVPYLVIPEPAVQPKASTNQMLSGKDWGDMIMLAAFKGGAAAYFIAPLAYDGLGK
jgi:hypothetical protein